MRFTIGTAFMPPDHYIPLAKAAEAAGYDSMAVSDHVLDLETLSTPYPYTKDGKRRWEPGTPWLDPWVAIGAMGAVTERLRFTTNVYVLPMRNPFVVAKAVATAAVLTGGRVSLGIGMGWCEEEFELMEQPFAKRGARADEALQLMERLWTGEVVEHHGDFYDIPRLQLAPATPGPIPIVVGGLSEAALKRAARHDGWMSDFATIDELGEFRRRIEEHRDALGRTDLSFALYGSPKDAVTPEDFARAESVGVTDIVTMPWAYYHGFTDDLAQKVEGLERFAVEVMSQIPSA